eukprot:gene18867-biopygen910
MTTRDGEIVTGRVGSGRPGPGGRRHPHPPLPPLAGVPPDKLRKRSEMMGNDRKRSGNDPTMLSSPVVSQSRALL